MANEKRLIDANALIEDIEKRYCEPCKAEGKDYCEVACRACWVDDMILEIDPAPTIDAVEVVRCKECKNWKDIGKGCTDHVRCCEVGCYMIGENGYCYFGERSTDHDNS